jgi:hypothetical protein
VAACHHKRGPAGPARMVQPVPQRLPAVPGAPQGSVDRDPARLGAQRLIPAVRRGLRLQEELPAGPGRLRGIR